MDMFDLLAQRARLMPAALAVEDLDDGTRYSYAALNERAARVAAAARELWGIGEGGRLAYLGHNRAEFFALLFGCAKAGIILVPLNWRLAVPELSALLADAEPAALIYGDEFAGVAAELGKDRPELSLIALGEAAGGRDYAADLAAVAPPLTPHPPRSANTPWYLLYTSGTTGRPKGVIQTFRMMLANYMSIGLAVGLRREDVLLNVLPMFHTAGINLYSTAMFLVGGSVLVARSFEPAQALAVLASRATLFFGVPAIYQALLEQPAFAAEQLRGVRSWGCGGAALPPTVAQRYLEHGIRIRTGCGMTETGPTISLLDEASVPHKIGSVGRPQLTVELRIVDHQGRDLPPGQPGEMLIRGPGVTPGYWRQPEATRAAIELDGWFHSGDVAYCDADGDYYLIDRWKDMYVSGGENVYPAEVEQVLLQYPDIAEAAVVGVADERWGEVGKAYLRLADGAPPLDQAVLREFCRQRLAGYKVPRNFEVVAALPRNALGKVQKQELRNAARQ